jgi:transcriptional regulator with XRE-family HTH domain
MNNNENGLSQRIKLIRIKNGMTLEEFGKQILNANKSVASKWERGVTVPNNKRLLKIAEVGNVTIDYLLSGNSVDNLQPEVRQTLGEVEVLYRADKTLLSSMTHGEIKEIERYQKKNCISSFTDAVQELIRKGLSMSNNQDSK